MARRSDIKARWKEDQYADEWYRSRERCLTTMMNRSAQMTYVHCEPDWDPLNTLCWGPTPAGMITKLRCPDDGFLNPKFYATRTCLPTGQWYVNETFDDKPYTDFNDCFLKDVPTAVDNLRILVGDHIMRLLTYMDEYEAIFLTLHIISIALLVASSIVNASLVLKVRGRHYLTLTYGILAIAAVALLLDHSVTISVSAVGDAMEFVKCRIAKSLITFGNILFYECLFVFLYLCNARILDFVVKELYIKMAVLFSTGLAFALVLTRQLTEIHNAPTSYCGFRHLQTTYHWFTTAPKVFLLMCVTCLDSVAIFGVFWLKQPHLEKSGEIRHIRQMSISALVVISLNIVGEILLILIHTEEYMKYAKPALINIYIHAFSLVSSIQGIVFSVCLCLLDLGVLSFLGLPFQSSKDQKRLRSASLEEAQSPCLLSEEFRDLDSGAKYYLKAHDGIEGTEMTVVTDNKGKYETQRSGSVRAPRPRSQQYVTKFHYGPVKQL